MKLIHDLYNYRELLKSNVKKEIRGKYKGSFLGILWSFINPLLQTIVYTIVFSIIMKNSMDNYLIFVVTGIIPWNFFLTTMIQGITTIKSNAGIIKKVYFPREILPISVVLSGLVNFFISCLIILLFCLFSGIGISWHIIIVPFIAVIQFFFTLGLVFALSAINIYIQDTEYIIQFILNMVSETLASKNRGFLLVFVGGGCVSGFLFQKGGGGGGGGGGGPPPPPPPPT